MLKKKSQSETEETCDAGFKGTSHFSGLVSDWSGAAVESKSEKTQESKTIRWKEFKELAPYDT